MGYTTDSKVLADVVDSIMSELLAQSSGYWTDGDTSWTTATRTENNARRVAKFNNGTETLYVAFEVINQTNGVLVYGSDHFGKGLRIVLSSAWDSNAHSYTTPTQSTFIPFEMHIATGGNVSADLATLIITYHLYVDDTGFVIMGKPDTIPGDNTQQSFFVCLERGLYKEYQDGYSNFYLVSTCNTYSVVNDNVNLMDRQRTVLRPFVYQYPSESDNNAFTSTDVFGFSGHGVNLIGIPDVYGFKSGGNNKAYYTKPVVSNSYTSLIPIMSVDMWFAWNEGHGLFDGDIIAVSASTKKYLCLAMSSPDDTTTIPIAIKYHE